MNLINFKSRRGFVNLFADFILSFLEPFDKLSQIQVTDCKNFIVVGGKTSYGEVLDITKIKNLFINKYGEIYKSVGLEKLNIIDLIEYQTIPVVPKSLYLGQFYHTERPIYSESQISLKFKDESYISPDVIVRESLENYNCSTPTHYESFHLTSEFPYGYSIKNTRDKLYYCEYVSVNLFTILGTESLEYFWSDESIELKSKSFISVEKLDSLMKDVFDFELEGFLKSFENYQFSDDILKPLNSKPWLVKDKVKELYII